MTTLTQVEAEAKRRVDEDDCPRVIYMAIGAKLRICLLDDFIETDITEQAISIVWQDKVEIL